MSNVSRAQKRDRIQRDLAAEERRSALVADDDLDLDDDLAGPVLPD